jgi:glycosyltransferase involved in cell wall biosynthesis
MEKHMRVAIVHYWLLNMRGGEKVLKELCRLFPRAVIYTHVLDRTRLNGEFEDHEIRTTFISRLPFASKYYKKYLPLMPYALETLDLSEFDLVISSESGPAKGVIPAPGATHICYCHTPMRYIWDQYNLYQKTAGLLTRLAMPYFAHRLRMWDVTSSARVDYFIANSRHVSNRISKYYRRDSNVVFPPVDTSAFSPIPASEHGDHYLFAGELVAYKRPDIAINAFNASGRKLLVVGDGEMRVELERRAKSNITFLGKIPFNRLRLEFSRCQALIFPGEEDFGIIPVEVMASGRPVIALARGGALDTVIDGKTGLLFSQETVDGLNAAIEQFEAMGSTGFDIKVLTEHARGFGLGPFRRGFGEVLRHAGIQISDELLADDD